MPLMFQPLARYFDFQGRSRRSEYWLWFLFQIIVGIVFMILQNTLRSTGVKAILIPIVIVRVIYGLGIIIPNIAVAVRRSRYRPHRLVDIVPLCHHARCIHHLPCNVWRPVPS